MKCIDCGCDEENRDSLIRGSGGMVHQRWSYCLKATIKERDELARRVAELEARLADEWRSVGTAPLDTDVELKIKASIRIAPGGEMLLYRPDIDYFIGPSNDEWEWRPLPPPPNIIQE